MRVCMRITRPVEWLPQGYGLRLKPLPIPRIPHTRNHEPSPRGYWSGLVGATVFSFCKAVSVRGSVSTDTWTPWAVQEGNQ